jgi:DUF4097 and DUF4098 domain-containing protein YvlB
MSSIAEHSARFTTLVAAVCLLSALPAIAQDAGHEWQKQYSLNGRPALTLETGDANVDIHSCGDCKAIHIHVQSNRNLSNYRLEEHQDQNHVFFTFKEKMQIGIHINWKNDATKVTIDAPTALDLEARTSDGNLSAAQFDGNLQIHSSDGAVALDDTRGAMHLISSDGNISIHNASGTLEARTSDGSMKIDGQFTSVQLHTSDGHLDFALAPGSQLSAASSVESSDGNVALRVPKDLAADLDVTTKDGRLNCTLPLAMDSYNSGESGGHHVHGHLNAGGPLITVHTSDGNVTITAL